ncbi:MAG: hypothetical protein E8D44_14805, partial [Nitrospira sp.]
MKRLLIRPRPSPKKAQQKDYSEVDRLLALLQDPYSDQPGMDAYAAVSPNGGEHLAVSRSSWQAVEKVRQRRSRGAQRLTL